MKAIKDVATRQETEECMNAKSRSNERKAWRPRFFIQPHHGVADIKNEIYRLDRHEFGHGSFPEGEGAASEDDRSDHQRAISTATFRGRIGGVSSGLRCATIEDSAHANDVMSK